MSRNKLIMIASMMLTMVIVTSWLGENKPAPGSRAELEKTPSSSNPELAIHSSTDNECLSIPDFTLRHPDATPDEITEIEQCNQELEQATELDQTDTKF